METVLDKLVSATVSRDVPLQPTTTEKVLVQETGDSKPDEQLLTELTGSSETSQSGPVIDETVQTEPVKSDQAAQQTTELIKKDILNRLTDQSGPEDERIDHSSAGDSSDA